MKTLIYLWLITLSIITLALVLHVKRNTAMVDELQTYYIKADDRLILLEVDFEHNQDRLLKAMTDWFQDRRIVPVGNGMFLAVRKEKE